MLSTMFQLLSLAVVLHANAGRDRCAQIDTMSPMTIDPDMYGLVICATGTWLDGQMYTGQTLDTEYQPTEEAPAAAQISDDE
jgi:hypothetical protein